MEIEKAIEKLKEMYVKRCKSVNGRLKGGFIDEKAEKNIAIDMAIQALEKQVPKKVTGEYEDEPLCPCCLEVIDGYNVEIIKHCPECGQAIDWGVTSD